VKIEMSSNTEFLESLSLREGPKSRLLKFLENKSNGAYSLLQMKAKFDNIEEALEARNDALVAKDEARDEEISGLKETIRQLVGGLFNQRTQEDVIDLHLAEIYGTPRPTKKIDADNMWPTTRQGDANEIKIEELQAKNAALEEKGDANEKKIEELQAKNAALEKKTAALEEKMATTQQRLTDLEKIINRILG